MQNQSFSAPIIFSKHKFAPILLLLHLFYLLLLLLLDSFLFIPFFDATEQAEFLYECVLDTIENIIPMEITYMTNYDEFKRYLDDDFEMPDKMVALLVRFPDQNNGTLSKRAKENEFQDLSYEEIEIIEKQYQSIFQKD